ncbi:MAG: hypothetical protein KGO02_19375 [Alphaproteobacteria bacterium]|nr:hypothetical protein [Alphaproteobacteria bacterium]
MRHLAGAMATVLCVSAPAAFAASPLFHVRDSGADLTVASTAGPSGTPGVGGEAALNLDVAGLSTQIKGDAHATRRSTALAGQNGTRSADVQLDSRWHRGIVGLDLKAERKLDVDQHDGPSAQALYVAHSEQQNDSTHASATVTVQPLTDLSLAAKARNTSTTTVQNETFVGQTGTTSRVESASTMESFMATWKPLPQLTAEADATLAEGTLRLQNSSLAQLRWQAAEPRLSLTLTPFSGARLMLALDRRVTPVSPSDLAAWHAATGDLDSGLKPNTAQEFRVALDDHAGPLALHAAVSTEALQSTTVLAAGPGGQIPRSISGGSRQTADLAVALSMAPLGLSGAELSSHAAFRHSQIHDPVTGRNRALSGEIPEQASVKLTDSLPGSPLSFGLDGAFGTETHYYQVAQDTAIMTAPSAGAFIKYSPGSFALTLSVNGLGGGTEQQTAFYQGSRAGELAAISHNRLSSTTIGLSFSKALED